MCLSECFFFFNDTATTEIYTLSLHDALPICHGTASTLRKHGYNGTRCGHQQQWKLLHRQPHPLTSKWKILVPFQGPVVEKQQDEWEAHGHGLGHQSQRKGGDDDRVVLPLGPLNVPAIGGNREQRKNGAEQTFSLRRS